MVRDRLARLRAALDAAWPGAIIAYSWKTNYELPRLGVVPQAWAEVVSTREYALARGQGFPGERIVFNGPNKSKDGLERAFNEGAVVHLDHEAEVAQACALGAERSSPAAVGLRLKVSPTGRPTSRFGFSVDDGRALAAARRIQGAPGLRFGGLSAHLGTDVDGVADHAQVGRTLGAFAATLAQELGVQVTSFDSGGGYPGRIPPWGAPGWDPRPISTYIQAITDGLRETMGDLPPVPLFVEPGRYLAADAVVLFSRVLDVRSTQAGQDVLLDASSAMLPLVRYHPLAPRALAGDFSRLRSPGRSTRLLGASCVEDDILFEGTLASMNPGDHVAFYTVGAYNQTIAGSFIYEAPPTVLL